MQSENGRKKVRAREAQREREREREKRRDRKEKRQREREKERQRDRERRWDRVSRNYKQGKGTRMHAPDKEGKHSIAHTKAHHTLNVASGRSSCVGKAALYITSFEPPFCYMCMGFIWWGGYGV